MKTLALASLLLTSTLATVPAYALSGRTADGCSYKVINGQYLHSCDKSPVAPAPVLMASASQAVPVVTSYGDVPVRSGTVIAPSAAPQGSLAIVPVSTVSQGTIVNQAEEARYQKRVDQVVDATYAGASIGSTNVKEAGAATGFSASVGTLLDEYFGVELGYNYSKQGLQLGLAQRADPSGAGVLAPYSRDDANLRTHLITGELQAHLTNALKRFRPFVGAGLGWKSSSLEENRDSSLAYSGYGYGNGNNSNGSLSQSAFGALGSAGAKLKVGRAVYLNFAFRYFFPLAREDARLRQEQQVAYSPVSQSRLNQDDDRLTGSSQYQLQGGLQMAF